jgi:phosphoribosyl 1,2-cyclic phosphodiesterase
MGLPFLKPLYEHDVRARIHAGHFEDAMTCREMAERFMTPPFFPVTPQQFEAEIEFRDFRPPDELSVGNSITLGTLRLHHPNGCVGYRVNHGGRSACYVTDTEHVPGKLDGDLIELIRGADLMIYDCMYTDAEFDHYRGYGHSTGRKGYGFAKRRASSGWRSFITARGARMTTCGASRRTQGPAFRSH